MRTDFDGNDLPPMKASDWLILIACAAVVLGWCWAIIWYATK